MITSSRILPITLLIAMLRYLSEDGNDALKPVGIGMILAHINACGAKPWYIIDEVSNFFI